MKPKNQKTERMDFRLTPQHKAMLAQLAQGARSQSSYLVGLIEREAQERGIVVPDETGKEDLSPRKHPAKIERRKVVLERRKPVKIDR